MPEIIAGLYQLKVPIPNNPIGYVLPYLIETQGGYTLIDPGWNADESVDSLKRQLGDLGLSFKGNSSLNNPFPKKPLKFDIDQNDPLQEYYNMKALIFNNAFKDPSMVREALAYE